MDKIIKQLAEEFSLKEYQVENTVALIDEGNTIPFIARYRKEKTGSLSDDILRDLHTRLMAIRALNEKRADVLRLIDEQGKLDDELRTKIENAKTQTELDDIYRPFRPKRRTRATIAKEKGLEPLALLIFEGFDGDIVLEAQKYINPELSVETSDDAISGALDIIAEIISDDADIRRVIRELTYRNSVISVSNTKDEDSVYRNYYEYQEPVSKIANHRVLAINRGEKEDFLSVKVKMDEEIIHNFLKSRLIKKQTKSSEYIEEAIVDSYKRLIAPSIETEIRNILTERAGEDAIKVFSKNLSGLLLEPPVKGRTVMGVDPGYRTGCKIAVVDDTGKVLDTGIAYMTLPNHDTEKTKEYLKKLIRKHGVNLISVGNGTASKESEKVVSEIIKEINEEVYYMVVSEAGASVYSASKTGAEEFPDFDVALRSAVSIARRIQDPLAELVKIDPKSIGVGQYQHDMNQKRLGEALGGVVETCVNSVGVDLNTASMHLLSYVAGINQAVAKNITAYREENGKFSTRKELLKVSKLGEKAFTQCAGFLRISDGKEILDNTSVHPESYKATKEMLKILGLSEIDIKNGNLKDLPQKVKEYGEEKLSKELDIGLPTLKDIVSSLQKPGRDPRDELPEPVMKSEIMDISELKPGMIMTGTVRNVIDFGAFIDIGVHQDGLCHISEIADKFIKHPLDVLSVGDIVKVKILDVDVAKKRISLTIKGA